MTRKQTLDKILKPITWHYSTSIEYRKHLVTKRRVEVRLVYPFLTKKEKELANQWLENEKHDGLWD